MQKSCCRADQARLTPFDPSSSYNTSPPNAKTMTTAGGTQRLNPNLYAEGKICLSLLGTWAVSASTLLRTLLGSEVASDLTHFSPFFSAQGPGWVAGTSTLLQGMSASLPHTWA